MKRWLAGLLWMLLGGLALGQPLLDDRGLAVRLAQPPQRIVTLLPSLTETVCELGACDRLVGVDNYSNWPARIAGLPHVGGVDDASIERIVALRPDLVLLSSSSRAITRLEGLGVPVMGLDLKTMADVRRVLGKVAQALGLPQPDALWQRMDAGIDATARALPRELRGTTVYFEVSAGGYAASESSHIGEVLTRLGAVNVVPGRLGSVPKLNPEFVVRADPQVVIMADRITADLRGRPGWQGMRAVREGRVCSLTPAEGDVIARPGPRLAEGARILARCLQLARARPAS